MIRLAAIFRGDGGRFTRKEMRELTGDSKLASLVGDIEEEGSAQLIALDNDPITALHQI
jgi:hypothetical protein